MASQEMIGLKEMLFERRRQALGGPRPSLEEMRANTDAAFAGLPAVSGVTNREASDGEVAAVAAEWTLLDGAEPRGTILYFHGGAYRQGSIVSHRRLVAALCVASGMRGLSIGYRLAPESPYPAALEDATASYRWLAGRGGEDPERVIVAGDSAGGGLALATLIAVRDLGGPLPAGCYAMSPWTDLACTGDSVASRADIDPVVEVASLLLAAKWYLPEGDPRQPLVSPLYADLVGLPPLLIHVGEAEVIHDDSTRFAEKARSAGVDVQLTEWPEAFHVHQQMTGVLPEADQAMADAAAWMARCVG